jgi:hypothetical protein
MSRSALALLTLLPFLSGFIRPSFEVKELIRKEEWAGLKSLVISRARSEAQLDKSLAQLQTLIRDHETCRQQLKLHSVPLKCFDVLAWERKAGLIGKDKWMEMTTILDKMCEEASADMTDLGDLRFAGLKKSSTSPKCRTFLAKRMEILKYKAVESDPKELFDLRWR